MIGKTNLNLILASALSFAAGAVALSLWSKPPVRLVSQDDLGERHLGAWQFINPLLDCPTNQLATPPVQARIESKLRSYISENVAVGSPVEKVGVYFRDLNNGTSFGIDANESFTGASLLKVPVMIGYFKRLEREPALMSETIVYDPARHRVQDRTPNIQPPDELIPGRAYPIDQLIARMITLSDNTAASMLVQNMGSRDVVSVLKDMGIFLSQREDDAWIRLNDYAAIFRILYNSTYLEREYSNGSLQLLSNCRFKDGLVAGVDPGIVVAHKFGERRTGTLNQFHDCGIVYAPGRPYMLCIMTRGQKMEPLISTVAQISRLVFDEIRNSSNQ